MIKFFRKIKETRKKHAYNRGFDWAAGSLLRNELSPEAVDAYCYANGGFSTFDNEIIAQFDRGASDALRILLNAKVVSYE